MKNKKGITTAQMFLFVFGAFFLIVGAGIVVWVFDLIATEMAVDVNIGQVNLKDTVDGTFGSISSAMVLRADAIGVIILLGMVLLMILNGAFFGDKNRLWIIVDIVILVFVFILAVYISNIYETLINSSALLDVFINDLPKTSAFMLNLPVYVATIGALIMLATYAITRKQDEQTDVLGYG